MLSRTYVPVVSAIGLTIVGHCVSELIRNPIDPQWLLLAILTLLTGAFTIKVPSVPVYISVSETFVFTSVLLFGPCAGTLTVVLEILVVLFAGSRTKPQPPERIVFNVSSAALSIWLAGRLFFMLANVEPLHGRDVELQPVLIPLLLLASGYFFLNSGMVSLAIARCRARAAFKIWKSNFLPLSISYLAGASLAALLLSYTRTIDVLVLGVIVPLLVVSYLAFKTSFTRFEEATQHAEEMKALYVSAIETLATAIDAKDQVTHGHIRRVQKFALGLAAELGLRDEKQLRAIEAAALLHDTGKLVVPEHILKKPTRLTPAEFEKMKRHASAGAEILSAIKFPYPVVPIVRHHHENWDGSGYPDGLRGTAIPIGARILSVVDCFDALTSDRPYRKRVTDDQAVAILLARRGTMYDPLVVDAFIAIKDSLSQLALDSDHTGALDTPPMGQRLPSTRTVVESTTLIVDDELTSDVLSSAKQSTGADLLVLYVLDPSSDTLVAVSAAQQGLSNLVLSAIPVGTGVSGWVCANGAPIINAPSTSELDSSDTFGLASCSAVLIGPSEQPHGVLTAYKAPPFAFSERDIAALTEAARLIASRNLARPRSRPLEPTRGSTHIH